MGDDRVFVGEEDGTLHALDLATGATRLWSARLDARPVGSLWALEGPGATLLVSSQEGALFAVDGGSGTVLWRAELGDRLIGRPAASGGAVAVASGNGVCLFDAVSGAARGEYSAPASVSHFSTAGDSRVVFGDVSGGLTFLSSRDLSVMSVVRLPSAPVSLLSARQRAPGTGTADALTGLADDVVVATDRSGLVYFLRSPEASEGNREAGTP